jgi:hypothetical protein
MSRFPEASWGPTNKGIQVSIQFEKLTFTNNEPIRATVWVRNVTNESVQYIAIWSSRGGPADFAVFTEGGQLLKVRQDNLPDSDSVRGQTLPPRFQQKYVQDVDRQFDLTNETGSNHSLVQSPSPGQTVVWFVFDDNVPGLVL